jgi:hypothetical protein
LEEARSPTPGKELPSRDRTPAKEVMSATGKAPLEEARTPTLAKELAKGQETGKGGEARNWQGAKSDGGGSAPPWADMNAPDRYKYPARSGTMCRGSEASASTRAYGEGENRTRWDHFPPLH